ncbi:MAG: hypothetical protein JJU06_17680 [Ectothiorhodospiraceae bacterium]|nr:hypothetical protein [Ectothiorhodospiraceae bacterium]MCH8506590.1 hypothetical protein [Ectothiorhodospiraceae bacterium]
MVAEYSKAALVAVSLSIGMALPLVANGESIAPGSRQAELLKKRMAEAVITLERSVESCESQRSTLQRDAFEGAGISQDSLRLALPYFFVKADNACTRDSAMDFLLASHLMEEAGLAPGFNDRDGGSSAYLVVDSYMQEIENEAEYLSIPADERQALESIQDLHRPFDLISTAENLGLLPR